MKLALACLVSVVATSSVALADNDPGMQLMSLMMRCPAISSDGKHVAIYSNDPGSEKDARTSLAVFDASGALEQRISVVPPSTSAPRAKAAATTVAKLLDDGGYKRMARVAVTSSSTKKTAFTMQVKSEDVVLDIVLADRKVAITGTRAGSKLAPIARALAAKDGACTAVESYSLTNTMSGFDAKSGAFAFTIAATSGDTVCFAHDFVVTLK